MKNNGCTLRAVAFGILLTGFAGIASPLSLCAADAPATASAPAPLDTATAARFSKLKEYLTSRLARMGKASELYVKNAAAYAAFIDKAGGLDKAAAASPAELRKLISTLQDDYNALDSFGYETVEGIVAGVESMVAYDVYLDSGVPADKATSETPTAPVTLDLGGGKKIEGKGSLFTYIMAPSLWGKSEEFCQKVKIEGKDELLPDPVVINATAAAAHAKISQLIASGNEWAPSLPDCFGILITMTPTLSGYFDDWKESRYTDDKSGLFAAVSRVSDMKGIMTSVSTTYAAVQPNVEAKDKALAKSIDNGFKNILGFIEKVAEKEAKLGKSITPAQIDELAAQAKEMADKLVPQIDQASAIVTDKGTGTK
ncbi:MAG: hypothetical protein ACAI35_17950 [Candidatus Methylacidiphilales bacterium]